MPRRVVMMQRVLAFLTARLQFSGIGLALHVKHFAAYRALPSPVLSELIVIGVAPGMIGAMFWETVSTQLDVINATRFFARLGFARL